MVRKLNGNGRKGFSFSLKPKVVNEFSTICKEKGLVGSRQIELMMLKFIKTKEINGLVDYLKQEKKVNE